MFKSIIVFSFLLRLFLAVYLPLSFKFVSDAVRYVHLAKNLLNFGTFGIKPGVPFFLFPPGYPFFLAGIFSIAHQSLMAVRIIQVIMGTLMVWLTYLVGKKVWNRKIGLIAAFILCIYPVWIIWPSFYLTETLFTFLLLLFIYTFINYLRSKKLLYAALSGLVFSLAIYVREVLLLVLLVMPVVLLWARISLKRTLSFLVLFYFTFVLLITPWMVRNYRDFGEVLFTKRTRLSRYFGKRPNKKQEHGKKGIMNIKPDEASPNPEKLRVKGPEFYAYYGLPSDMYRISNLFNNPKLYMKRIGRRLARMWLHPKGLDSVPNKWRLKEIYVAINAMILFFAVLGLIAGIWKGREGIKVVVMVIFCVTATVLFFTVPHPRYVLPLQPLIFILAAIGLEVILRSMGFSKRDL